MIRARRRLLAASIIALALVLAPPVGGEGARSGPSTEPSAPLDLGARLIGLSGSGDTRRATVELVLLSREDLAEVVLQRDPADDPSNRRDIALPGKGRRLRALQARKVRISLDLAAGTVHHLRFSLEGVARSGRTAGTTAYLRVNLDPSLMPEEIDLGDEERLQYRALRAGSRP